MSKRILKIEAFLITHFCYYQKRRLPANIENIFIDNPLQWSVNHYERVWEWLFCRTLARTHTHTYTLERMQADANRRAPIKTRIRTHLMSFWTMFQLSIFASIINDVIKTSSKRGHLASPSYSTYLRSYSNTFKLDNHKRWMNSL